MVTFKSGTTSGTVTPFNPKYGFRFVRTPEGDVFVSPSLLGGQIDKFVPGACVKLEYHTVEKGLAATKIVSVREPAPLVFNDGVVKFFNEKKNFGIIHQSPAFPEKDIFLHISVAQAAGVMPWPGLAIQFAVEEGRDDKLRAVVIQALPEKDDSPVVAEVSTATKAAKPKRVSGKKGRKASTVSATKKPATVAKKPTAETEAASKPVNGAMAAAMEKVEAVGEARTTH